MPQLFVIDDQNQILACLDELLLHSIDLLLERGDGLSPFVSKHLEEVLDGHGSDVNTLGLLLFLLTSLRFPG